MNSNTNKENSPAESNSQNSTSLFPELENNNQKPHYDAVIVETPIENNDQNLSEIRETSNVLKDFLGFLKEIIIILLIVLLVRFFVFSPFRIEGPSMQNTYQGGEFLLVNHFSYLDFSTRFDDILSGNPDPITKTVFGTLKKIPIHIGDPSRGDIVVIRPHLPSAKEFFLKRIIGMPGDTIRFDNGLVFIKKPGQESFVKLEEKYLSLVNQGNTFLPQYVKEKEFVIPEKSYWVMGDNRTNSSDSRNYFGNYNCDLSPCIHFLPRGYIVGKIAIDFGHFSIFSDSPEKKFNFSWVRQPRIFNTPKGAEYPELGE